MPKNNGQYIVDERDVASPFQLVSREAMSNVGMDNTVQSYLESPFMDADLTEEKVNEVYEATHHGLDHSESKDEVEQDLEGSADFFEGPEAEMEPELQEILQPGWPDSEIEDEQMEDLLTSADETSDFRILFSETNPPGKSIYINADLKIKGTDSVTGIFVPKSFKPSDNFEVIIYLHGFKYDTNKSPKVCFRGICPSTNIDNYWKNATFPLREALDQAGRNAILVAPTLSFKSNAGNLILERGFDLFLNRVLRALTCQNVIAPCQTIGKIVLAAHSGGGSPMLQMAIHPDKHAKLVKECWCFDALYGGTDHWVRWINANPERKFYTYYLGTTPAAISEEIKRRCKKLDPRSFKRSDVKHHWDLVLPYWKERIADIVAPDKEYGNYEQPGREASMEYQTAAREPDDRDFEDFDRYREQEDVQTEENDMQAEWDDEWEEEVLTEYQVAPASIESKLTELIMDRLEKAPEPKPGESLLKKEYGATLLKSQLAEDLKRSVELISKSTADKRNAICIQKAGELITKMEHLFIHDPATSSLDLLPGYEGSRYRKFKWEKYDYPGNAKRYNMPVKNEYKATAMHTALRNIRPEHRINAPAAKGTEGKYKILDVYLYNCKIQDFLNGALQPVTSKTAPFTFTDPDNKVYIQEFAKGKRVHQLLSFANESFSRMRELAKKDGVPLIVGSAYRKHPSCDPKKKLKKTSSNPMAMANFSNHSLGLALDLHLSFTKFKYSEIDTTPMKDVVRMRESPVHKWMFLKSASFGWFPFINEPWHWEYNPDGFKKVFWDEFEKFKDQKTGKELESYEVSSPPVSTSEFYPVEYQVASPGKLNELDKMLKVILPSKGGLVHHISQSVQLEAVFGTDLPELVQLIYDSPELMAFSLQNGIPGLAALYDTRRPLGALNLSHARQALKNHPAHYSFDSLGRGKRHNVLPYAFTRRAGSHTLFKNSLGNEVKTRFDGNVRRLQILSPAPQNGRLHVRVITTRDQFGEEGFILEKDILKTTDAKLTGSLKKVALVFVQNTERIGDNLLETRSGLLTRDADFRMEKKTVKLKKGDSVALQGNDDHTSLEYYVRAFVGDEYKPGYVLKANVGDDIKKRNIQRNYMVSVAQAVAKRKNTFFVDVRTGLCSGKNLPIEYFTSEDIDRGIQAAAVCSNKLVNEVYIVSHGSESGISAAGDYMHRLGIYLNMNTSLPKGALTSSQFVDKVSKYVSDDVRFWLMGCRTAFKKEPGDIVIAEELGNDLRSRVGGSSSVAGLSDRGQVDRGFVGRSQFVIFPGGSKLRMPNA